MRLDAHIINQGLLDVGDLQPSALSSHNFIHTTYFAVDDCTVASIHVEEARLTRRYYCTKAEGKLCKLGESNNNSGWRQ